MKVGQLVRINPLNLRHDIPINTFRARRIGKTAGVMVELVRIHAFEEFIHIYFYILLGVSIAFPLSPFVKLERREEV